jgi:hypothetical protein
MLDEDLARELAHRMQFGASFYRAAKSMGLSTHTAYKWMHKARLGIPPYRELMFPVIQAATSWKTKEQTTRLPESTPGFAERPRNLSGNDERSRNCAKSRRLVPV